MRLTLAILIVCTATAAVFAQSETTEELVNSSQDLFLSDDDTIVDAAMRSGGASFRPISTPSYRPTSPISSGASSSAASSSLGSKTGSGLASSSLSKVSNWLSNPFGKSNLNSNSGSNPTSKPNWSPNLRPSVNLPTNPKPNVNPDSRRKPTDLTNPKDKKQDPSKSGKGKNQNGGANSGGSSGGGPSGGGGIDVPTPSLPDLGGLSPGGSGSGSPDSNQGTNPYNSGGSTGGNQYDPNSNQNPDQPASGSGTFPYFSQSDPRWSNERIGKTKQSIGGGGSVITSLAMLLGGFNLRVGNQASNPSSLNQYLTKSQGYSGNGEVNWSALKNLGFDTVGPFKSFDEVIQSMSSGNYCILNVGKRWVLATGISGNNYDVMDPQNQSKKTYPSKQASAARCFVRLQ